MRMRVDPRVVLFVLFLVMVASLLAWGINERRKSSADTPPAESTSRPTDQPSSFMTGVGTDLEITVTRFVELYESPSSQERTILLRSLCITKSACRQLGLEGVDTSNAAQAAKEVVMRVQDSPENSFELKSLGNGFVLVSARLNLVTERPDSTDSVTIVTYETVWKERELDGWKFVAIKFG